MATYSYGPHDAGTIAPQTGGGGGGGGKKLKSPLTYPQIPGTGDIKVLNYALTLEALEADLYSQALLRLTTGGTNALGDTITGLGLATTEADVEIVAEFGGVEADHRNFLETALGSKAITSIYSGQIFFDFSIGTMTRLQVLQLLLTAEALGVQAYLGAIPFFADKKYLQTAGSIQGVEARHAAVLTELVNEVGSLDLPVAPLATTNGGRDSTMTPEEVLAAVAPFIVIGSQAR